MISAVLDTNVLASGFVAFARPDSAPGELLRRWTYREFELVVSAPILAELERTLQDRYFAKRLLPELRARDLALLRTEARIVGVAENISGIATHPEDDVILATAISARAAYLVSGDRQLQRLTHFRNVQIVSPRAFLVILTVAPPAE